MKFLPQSLHISACEREKGRTHGTEKDSSVTQRTLFHRALWSGVPPTYQVTLAQSFKFSRLRNWIFTYLVKAAKDGLKRAQTNRDHYGTSSLFFILISRRWREERFRVLFSVFCDAGTNEQNSLYLTHFCMKSINKSIHKENSFTFMFVCDLK